MLNEYKDKIELQKEVLAALPRNNNKNNKLYKAKVEEMLKEYQVDKEVVEEEITKRRNRYLSLEYDKNIDEHNVERIVAKILFDLTRNTGFEVSKGSIGDCWIKSCCDWKERTKDDICGLNYSKLSIYDKMKIIYEETCLKEQFSIAGLEVA